MVISGESTSFKEAQGEKQTDSINSQVGKLTTTSPGCKFRVRSWLDTERESSVSSHQGDFPSSMAQNRAQHSRVIACRPC